MTDKQGTRLRQIVVKLYENGKEIGFQTVFLVEDNDPTAELIKCEERQIGLGARAAYRAHLFNTRRAYQSV